MQCQHFQTPHLKGKGGEGEGGRGKPTILIIVAVLTILCRPLTDCRESDSTLCLLSHFEHFGLAVLCDVIGDFKVAKGTYRRGENKTRNKHTLLLPNKTTPLSKHTRTCSFCMDHTLRNPLPVKVAHLIKIHQVLQEQQTQGKKSLSYSPPSRLWGTLSLPKFSPRAWVLWAPQSCWLSCCPQGYQILWSSGQGSAREGGMVREKTQ